jgi:hypothetical protein
VADIRRARTIAARVQELYDLTDDPVEACNRWTDPDLHDLRQHLRAKLKHTRASSIPERNQPWPYASRRPPSPSPFMLARWFARS